MSKTLRTAFLENQDSLHSRSIFRFLAFLVNLGVISAESSITFLKEILNMNTDLALHCVLTFLCAAKLGGGLDTLLKEKFDGRQASDSLT